MQSQLVQNFTSILEWGQGTCSLTKHTRPVFFPSMLPTPLCANFVKQSDFLKTFFFVKLHFELADLIQLKLVRVEVNLVFPCHNKNSNNPHLTFTGRKGQTCLIFCKCLIGVWRVSAVYLLGVWKVSGRCLEGFYKVYGDRPSQNTTGQVRTGQARIDQVWTGQARVGQVSEDQVWTGHVRMDTVVTGWVRVPLALVELDNDQISGQTWLGGRENIKYGKARKVLQNHKI